MLFLGAAADTFGLAQNPMPLKIAFNNLLYAEKVYGLLTNKYK
jgi:hypothetical protein